MLKVLDITAESIYGGETELDSISKVIKQDSSAKFRESMVKLVEKYKLEAKTVKA